jgi:glycosyltransferase involved in cell wall biosynthesis
MGVAERTETVLPLDRFESTYRSLTPAFPALARRIEAEYVVSSSYAFAHYARGRRLHVEYCHSPLRQIWIQQAAYEGVLPAPMRVALRASAPLLRRLDRSAVGRVDEIVASCVNVRDRIFTAYGRRAPVIYPPVAIGVGSPPRVERERGLAIIVGRIVEPYKRVGEAIEAFRSLPYRLAIIGGGRDAAKLRARAPRNVEFVGELDDAELRRWYARAEVVLFPSEDDFGIVPVEAMSFGTPVVARDAGGARETVVAGSTGILYRPGQIAAAVDAAMNAEWDRGAIREQAARFRPDRFRRDFTGLLETVARRAVCD